MNGSTTENRTDEIKQIKDNSLNSFELFKEELKQINNKQKNIQPLIIESCHKILFQHEDLLRSEISGLYTDQNNLNDESESKSKHIKSIKFLISKTFRELNDFLNIVTPIIKTSDCETNQKAIQINQFNEVIYTINKNIYDFIHPILIIIKQKMIEYTNVKILAESKDLIDYLEEYILEMNLKSLHTGVNHPNSLINYDDFKNIMIGKELNERMASNFKILFNQSTPENILVKKDTIIDSRTWFNLSPNASKGLINLLIKIQSLCGLIEGDNIKIFNLCDDFLTILDGKLMKKDLIDLYDLLNTSDIKFSHLKSYLKRFIDEFDNYRKLAI